jgi:hypothetical protein
MLYAVWDAGIADNPLIAIASVLHVFVYHLAIGGGLYLVLAETLARRKNDSAHLAGIKRQSRFFALITLIFGAVTGLGLWITGGWLDPAIWGRFSVWVSILILIAAAMLYSYGWKRLASTYHLTTGWIYFLVAGLSLMVIVGGQHSTLTGGDGIVSGGSCGFIDPSFWPAVLFSACICFILAGLYAVFTLSKEKNTAFKIRHLRCNGVLVLISLAAAVPFGWWYYKTLPADVTSALIAGTAPAIAAQVMIVAAAMLFLLTLLGTVLFPRHSGYVSAAVLLLCALLFVGGFVWTRQSICRPRPLIESHQPSAPSN